MRRTLENLNKKVGNDRGKNYQNIIPITQKQVYFPSGRLKVLYSRIKIKIKDKRKRKEYPHQRLRLRLKSQCSQIILRKSQVADITFKFLTIFNIKFSYYINQMFDSDDQTNQSKIKQTEKYQQIFPRKQKPYLKSLEQLKKIRKISQGSFGIVYQYFNPNKNQFYAVKQMKWSNKKSIINQIKRQIDLLYKINSPNLVKLYDHFVKKQEIYLVMEFVDGNNLYDEILKPKKQLNFQIISNIILDICSGLIELHKNKIVHRDLKLQNVMMSSKGQIKIIDLGQSNFYGEGIQRKTTRGTKTYFSPQITNKQGQDDRIDIWCLGVIIYEIICLQSPFRGITQDQLYENIRRFRYPIPQKIKNDKLLLNLFSRIFTWHAQRIDIHQVKNHPWIQKNLMKNPDEPPKFERLFRQSQVEQYRNLLMGQVQRYKNQIKTIKEQNKQLEKMIESCKQKKIQNPGKEK